MKDKNTLIGWLLIALVFVGFMMYNSKDAEKRAAAIKKQQAIEALAQQKSDSIAKIEAQKQAEKELAELSDSTNALFKARQGSAGTTVIQNELLKLTISNKGGQLQRAEILDPTYKNQQGGNVVLFDAEESNMQFIFEGKEDNIISDEFFFTPKEVSKDAVTMSLPVGGGSIDINYSLVPNSYLVNMNVQANGLKGFFPAKADKFMISWNEKMRQQEKGYTFENRYSTITYRDTEDDTDELSSAGADKEKDSEDFDENLKWLAFKTQFFSQILIPEETLDVEKMSSKQLKEVKGEAEVKYLKNLKAELTTPFDPSGKNPTNMKMYLGPNKFQTLQENEKMLGENRDLDLQSIVYLGWPIIRWINRFIFIYLFDWLTGWGLNMGLVLLLITLIVKFAVYPLMKKSYLSSANMRVLRPKIDEINAKYTKPEDAMVKQQET
ncbi:MAG: membrane protein insertase YidC, partial [Bacteroidaceae bacterium]|nr:membrane protein insertase YidC [Bacteroidaceae bacterium]